MAMILFAFAIGGRNALADMFLVAEGYIARYDEKTGELLHADHPAYSGETIDRATIGPDGDIYALVQTFWMSSVQRFDGRTGEFKDIFAPQEFGLPSALQFGLDGDLFVAWRYADGSRTSVVRVDGKTGALKSKFIDGDYSVNEIVGMAIGADGTVYMVEGPSELVIRDGKTAAALRRFAAPEPSSFRYYDCLAFGRDQSLYWFHANVYRVDVESGALTKVIDLEAAGMTNAVTMRIGPEGDFYFADPNGDIARFDGKTGASKGIVSRHPNLDWNNGVVAILFSGPRLWFTTDGAGAALRFTDTQDNFVLESNAAIGSVDGWTPVEFTATNKWPDLEIGMDDNDPMRIFRLRRR